MLRASGEQRRSSKTFFATLSSPREGQPVSMPPATSHASKKRKASDATQLNVAANKAAQVIDVLIPNEVGQSVSAATLKL